MPGAEVAAQLAGVLLFALPGAAIATLVPGLRGQPPARRWAYGYLLGVAWVAGALFALSLLFAVPLRRPAVLAVAAVPLLAWATTVVRRRGAVARRPAAPRTRRRGAEVVAAVVAGVVFLGVLADVFANPLRDWDGRMIWAAHARYMRAAGSVLPPALTEPGSFLTQPAYPPLLPVAQVAVLELVGAAEDQHAFRGMYAFFYPVWLLLIYAAARRHAGRTPAALVTLAAALLPMPAIFRGGGAVSAYSDLPLACFYGGGFLLLQRSRARLPSALAGGLLLGAAVLSKNEGTPLAIVALTVAALAPVAGGGLAALRRQPQRRRALALAALVVAVAAVGLTAWRAHLASSTSWVRDYVEAVGGKAGPGEGSPWVAAVTRLPRLFADVGREMASTDDWGLFWPAALLVLLAARRGLLRATALPLALLAAAPVPIAWVAYAISHRPDDLVHQTWNRFLLQVSIPLLALLAMALAQLLPRRRAGVTTSPRPA